MPPEMPGPTLCELEAAERKACDTLRDALRATVPDPARGAAVMAAADSWRRASLRAAEKRREVERCAK